MRLVLGTSLAAAVLTLVLAPQIASAAEPDAACFKGPPGTDYTKPYQAPAMACGLQRVRGLPEDAALPVEVTTRLRVLDGQISPGVKEMPEQLGPGDGARQGAIEILPRSQSATRVRPAEPAPQD